MSNDSTKYLIKSENGYWRDDGYGYTQLQSEAGRFQTEDFAEFNQLHSQVLAEVRRV